ncbi:unnamed protein product, partial [Ectocarpus sp. 12 AP-2014]
MTHPGAHHHHGPPHHGAYPGHHHPQQQHLFAGFAPPPSLFQHPHMQEQGLPHVAALAAAGRHVNSVESEREKSAVMAAVSQGFQDKAYSGRAGDGRGPEQPLVAPEEGGGELSWAQQQQQQQQQRSLSPMHVSHDSGAMD